MNQQLLAPPQRLRRLQIEVTTFCNLGCEECSRTVGVNKGTWIDKHMSFSDFKRIINNCPPADTLVLQGVGEPSLNPELIDITQFAKNTNNFNHITLNTNAVTRSLKYFQELRHSGLTYVCISVDSFDDKIANECRFGTKVEKLARRIREIYREYDSVVISMVASQLNYFDIPKTLWELDKIGEEIKPGKRFVVEIVPVIDYKDESTNKPHNNLSKPEIYRLAKIIQLLSPQLPHLAPEINAGFLKYTKQGQLCARPFFSPFITVDGYMTPCCTTFDPKIYQYTNLKYLTMNEAWTSPPVNRWLKHYFLERDPICDGCAFNIG
jgi:MoaA/NifB/PqqE/SkfB family radical SAM enzyme